MVTRSSDIRPNPSKLAHSPWIQLAMQAAWSRGMLLAARPVIMPASTSPLPAVARVGGAFSLIVSVPLGVAIMVWCPLSSKVASMCFAACWARSWFVPSKEKMRLNSPSCGVNIALGCRCLNNVSGSCWNIVMASASMTMGFWVLSASRVLFFVVSVVPFPGPISRAVFRGSFSVSSNSFVELYGAVMTAVRDSA